MEMCFEKEIIKIFLRKYIIIITFFFLLINARKKKTFTSNRPKISIFLPIYNKDKFLIRSIKSIQIQTLNNIEIIAVNDGSIDNSLKILKKLAKKDLRIKIINNDRNHGLLYSRAMGILNSTGEYVMNLDPDDIIKDKINLEKLYYKTKETKSDLIIFLIERILTNEKENISIYLENKFQLQRQDFRITNKLIGRNIIIKAFEYYCKYIYRNRWNFHEDNIWNLLVRKFSKKTAVLNEYIYIYKRNNESLNMMIGNIIDIKNRIYRLKLLIKFYKIFNSNIYYYDLHHYIKNFFSFCNASMLKDEKEIKRGIIQILFELLNIFKTKKYINNILNKISDDKIILLINSKNKSLNNYLDNISIFKYFNKNNTKIITSIDINNRIIIFLIFMPS